MQGEIAASSRPPQTLNSTQEGEMQGANSGIISPP